MKKETKRKGGRTLKDVPVEIRQQLNQGLLETANLMEGLSIDFPLLLKNTLNHSLPEDIQDFLKKLGITQKMKEMGLYLIKKGISFKDITTHPSDTLRGWAAYMIAYSPNLNIEEKLNAIMCLADDLHFGVREWAWLALRPYCVEMPEKMISLLEPWTNQTDNLRRFASEITRPRGVWCFHIQQLKDNPALALPILSNLKADPSRYVQNSVANWLNDSAKSKPEWVKDLCKEWQQQSSTAETFYICKRGLRNC
ncbi:MAG: DNA alkylation repair protein [Alphaproteobacteria bacterium]|nr:DNA alkylation repair protein [Alphaproteobacteria bacterium]